VADEKPPEIPAAASPPPPAIPPSVNPSPATPSRGQAWRTAPVSTAGPSTTARQSRTRQFVIFGFLFLALLGAFIGFLFYIQKPDTPFLLTVSMSDYKDPLFPPLPYAQQDSAGLEQYFEEGRRKNGFNSQERGLLLAEFDELARAKHKHLIIHLRAHALTRGDTVYLIPGNGRADDSNTWVSLQELLTKIEACPAKFKMLLLDLYGPIADPRLGQLDDDLAGKVQPILENRNDKNLRVICGCSAKEHSLTSEELQRSVFAYYLDLGLRGFADKNDDERVTAQELTDYIPGSVQRWAVMNRSAQQKPVVLTTTGKDFEIVVAKKAGRKLAEDPPALPVYPDWLADGWKLRKQWQDEKRYAEAPLVYREYEATLLYTEQDWRGGRDVGRVKAEFLRRQDILTGKMNDARSRIQPRLQPEAVSLAQLRVKVDSTLRAELLEDAKRADKPNPNEKPEVVEARRTKWYKYELEKGKGKFLTYTQFAALVWDLVLKGDAIQARPRFVWLDEVLSGFPATGTEKRPLVETMCINRLAKWQRTDQQWIGSDFQQALQLLIQLIERSERLLATEPVALQWHQEDIETRGVRLWDLQERFFGSDWRKEDMRQLSEEYDGLLDTTRKLQRGIDTFDEATVMLPAALFYLTRAPRIDDGTWGEARDACAELKGLLYRPLTEKMDKQRVDRITSVTERLSRRLDTLYQPVRPAATKALVNEVGIAKPTLYADMRLRLESPAVAFDERSALIQGMRTMGGKLQDDTNALDIKGPPSSDLAGGLPAWSMTEQAQQQKARVVLDLLKMVGVPMKDRLDQTPVDPIRLQEAWAVTLLKMYRENKVREEKQWLMVGLHPFAAREDNADKDFAENPSAERLREIRLRYWTWMGKYYETARAYYSERKPPLKELEEFYKAAGNDYTLRAATAPK